MPSTYTTVAGTSYSSFDAAFGATNGFPTAGNYTALPPFGKPPTMSAIEYEEIPITFAGVDDVGLKILGRRGQNCTVEFILVGADKDAAQARWTTLAAIFVPTTRFTIALPGGASLPGWKLARNSCEMKESFTIGTSVCIVVVCEFRRYSTSN